MAELGLNLEPSCLTPAMASSSSPIWPSLRNVLSRTSSFTPPAFEPGPQNMDLLASEHRRVLVVGAGGLGCEILKNLALSGFTNIDVDNLYSFGSIEVIDIDTVELSNLNRQFLFRQSDISRPKANAAAEFVQKRCPGIKITPHCKKIQEFPPEFYSQFFIVIAGLDNVDARRWLNATLFDLVQFDEDGTPDISTIVPLIDGGTEGFKGQARLFFPHITSCYECSVDTLPTQHRFAMCTLASVPRIPEHCIAYALEVEWPKCKILVSQNRARAFIVLLVKQLASPTEYLYMGENDDGDEELVKLDTDDHMHMQWLYLRAEERAIQFGISGVTYSLTMQVVKNIIPAIAATNAVIAAACVNEALKVATWMAQPLSNYFMYIGSFGVYGRTFPYDRKRDCIVCGKRQITVCVALHDTLQDLIDKLKGDSVLKLSDPSLATDDTVLWLSNKVLRAMYEPNLDMRLEDLFPQVDSSTSVFVTDKQTLGATRLTVTLQFQNSNNMDISK